MKKAERKELERIEKGIETRLHKLQRLNYEHATDPEWEMWEATWDLWEAHKNLKNALRGVDTG